MKKINMQAFAHKSDMHKTKKKKIKKMHVLEMVQLHTL